MSVSRIFRTAFYISIFASVLMACTKDEEEQPENTGPTASFTVTPTLGNTSTEFQLDASASADAEDAQSALSFRWDVNNDGIWDTPFASSPFAKLTYDEEGNFTIKLEVKDTGGLTSYDSKDVEVNNSINLPPNAPSDPGPADQATEVGTGAILSWNCTDPNQDPLTYDVYFGTNDNPPKAGSDIATESFDPGQLDPNTTYYWKVIAKDDSGLTTSGPVWQFTTGSGPTFVCGNPYTDDRDGKVYNTKQFGDNCWMTRNLNYGSMVNGADAQADNAIPEKYCYNDDPLNCNTYGGLDQWGELMQYGSSGSQGLCPAGWHPATLEDWQELEMELGMSLEDAQAETGWVGTDQGKELKEGDFAALLGGYRGTSGSFIGENFTGRFWTGTQSNSANAWNRNLSSDDDRVQHGFSTKEHGYAVRCVKD
jgi:uncharacterized protein (TIGR02145 family)